MILPIFFIAIVIIAIIIVANYVFYLLDYNTATSKGVPPEAYNKYSSIKSTSIWGMNYALYACKLENQTDVFEVASMYEDSEVSAYYFGSNGTQLCENHYEIDCRDECPECFNDSITNCTIIFSNS
jgi:hypothetical protein